MKRQHTDKQQKQRRRPRSIIYSWKVCQMRRILDITFPRIIYVTNNFLNFESRFLNPPTVFFYLSCKSTKRDPTLLVKKYERALQHTTWTFRNLNSVFNGGNLLTYNWRLVCRALEKLLLLNSFLYRRKHFVNIIDASLSSMRRSPIVIITAKNFLN